MAITYKCNSCGTDFLSKEKRKGNHKFCSQQCYRKWVDNGGLKGIHTKEKIEVNCNNCGKSLFLHESRYLENVRSHYCNQACLDNYWGKNNTVKCEYCGIEVKKITSSIKRTKHNFCSTNHQILWYKNNPDERKKREIKGSTMIDYKCSWCNNNIQKKKNKTTSMQLNHFCSRKCYSEYRTYMFAAENSPSYIEDRSNYRQIIRGGSKYNSWRIDVINKSGNKCEKCGCSENLQAHHIVTIASVINRGGINNRKDIDNFTEFFDVNNGVALCLNHHTEFHTKYGQMNCNKENLIEYLNNE